MTSLSKIVAGLTLALLASALPLTANESKDILEAAAKKRDKKGDRKAGKRKDERHDGHKLLSRDKMKRLKSGTHKIHSTNGHDVHARLKNGKIAGLHVKTPKGKKVNMKPRKNAPRKVALTQDEDAELIPVQMGGQIFFVFSAPGIQIVIAFPAPSCDPSADGSSDSDSDSGDSDSNSDSDSGN